MSEQIFELARLNKIRVMGIADTEDDTVRVVYLEAPSPYAHNPDITDFTRGPGKLTPRETIALGHILTKLGEDMLSGALRRDANLGEGST